MIGIILLMKKIFKKKKSMNKIINSNKDIKEIIFTYNENDKDNKILKIGKEYCIIIN